MHLPRKPRCQFVFVASGPPCAAARDAKKRLALRNGGELPKKKEGKFLVTLVDENEMLVPVKIGQ
jgi:hypothetical protein